MIAIACSLASSGPADRGRRLPIRQTFNRDAARRGELKSKESEEISSWGSHPMLHDAAASAAGKAGTARRLRGSSGLASEGTGQESSGVGFEQEGGGLRIEGPGQPFDDLLRFAQARKGCVQLEEITTDGDSFKARSAQVGDRGDVVNG